MERKTQHVLVLLPSRGRSLPAPPLSLSSYSCRGAEQAQHRVGCPTQFGSVARPLTLQPGSTAQLAHMGCQRSSAAQLVRTGCSHGLSCHSWW
jgi:hypothetical protein